MKDEDDNLVIPTDSDAPAGPVQWVWQPYLKAGTLILLDGDPGVGKTYVALDLAARLSSALPMPDGSLTPYPDGCRVVIANGDDVVEETLLPRFLAAGGRKERINFFGGISQKRIHARPAAFPEDFEALFHRLCHVKAVGLVVIDPFSALFPRVAVNDDQAVRAALAPFARLAARVRTCFLLVRHLNKSSGMKALYRGSGSIGLSAGVRSSLLAARHPDDRERCVLSMPKANLGPPGRSLCYRIGEREGGVGVIWEGPTSLTADELCQLKPDQAGPSQRAEKWLRELLANGPVPASQIEAATEAAGIGFTTLRSVKRKLGIESRRVFRDGRPEWEWVWPERVLEAL